MTRRRHSPRPVSLLLAAPNWLGDLVMSTSLLDMLAEPFGPGPGRRLTVAVRTEWMPLLAGDPRIDGLLPYERNGRHRGAAGLLRMAGDWRAGKHDTAILLPPSLRFAGCARLAGIPLRVGFKADLRSPLLTAAVDRPRRGTVHYCDELALLRDAWLDSGHPPRLRSLQAPPPSLPACAGIPAHPDLASGPEAWVLAVGATYGEAKSWPVEHAAEFARKVVESGRRLLLAGDAAACSAAERMRELVAGPWRGEIAGGPGPVDLVGRTTLEGVVSVLRGAGLFVGNDSGLMHLAAALGTPTLGLFGSTSPVWTGPRGRRTAVAVAAGFSCQPCYRRTCNQPVFCLEALTPDMVMDAALDLLAAAAEAGP